MEWIDLRRVIWKIAAAARKDPMQRNIIIALMVLGLALVAALTYALLRGQPHLAPISIDAADENAAEPLHQEMNCIDRLLQNNDLNANEVQPALARCRAGGSGNSSLEQ